MIRRPVVSGMFFAAVLILGLYSLKNTPVELVPDEKLPSLTISDFWFGASPESILERVALPVEEAISGIKGVRKVKTLCLENRLKMDIEFSRDTNMEFAYLAVKERLNRLRKDLPPSARHSLTVQPFVPEEFQRKPFLSVGIFSHLPLQSIRSIAEREFLPRLKGVAGVSRVEVWGGAEPAVKIILDPDKLNLYRINIYQVYSAVANSFFHLPSVSLQSSGREVILSLSSSASSVPDIEDVVVSKQGRVLRVKDLGRVVVGMKEITEEKRYQGMPVVTLDIYKEKGAPTLKLASMLKERIRRIEERLGGAVSTKIVEDESKELRLRLRRLIKLSGLILLIIFSILLLVFRDFKPSLLVISSVIFSVFATFTVVYILKIPVNLLTLSGFALGYGMFVDNAVVVFENIMRLREKGLSPFQAALQGAEEVVMPVLASTATTIIVFFSFAYFQGRLRIYYLPLAYIVAIALSSSVLIAFTLIPSLAARMSFRIRPKRRAGDKLFRFAVRYPLFVLLPLVLIFLLSSKLFYKNVTFGRFFSWYQKQRLDVWVKLPPGAAFEDTKKTILQFEKLVLSKPYPKEVKTWIRETSASMEVEFPREVEFSPIPYMLKQELIQLATNMAGIGIGVWGFDPQGYYYSPEVGSFLPYSIVIKGYDFEKLKAVSRQLIKNLLMNRRIEEAKVRFQKGFFWGGERKYYSMELRFDALRKFGVSPRNFLYQIAPAVRSRGIYQRVTLARREMDLEVRPKMQEPELQDLLKMEFISQKGIPYRVGQVVRLKEEKTKGGIEREDQQFIALVQWDYLGSFKKGKALEKTIYKNLTLPPGFTKSLEVPYWWMKESEMKQIRMAIFVSVLLIFLLLSMLYESLLQPLVVMMTIPLGLIGVFLAFTVTDFSFDSTAYIGLILLFGIAVNNAIVLVDHSNNYMKSGLSSAEAAVKGARERTRPIFITSATTVLGMLPLVLAHRGGQADIWTTLALCTVGGLTTSALLVPLVIPVFYHLSHQLKRLL